MFVIDSLWCYGRVGKLRSVKVATSNIHRTIEPKRFGKQLGNKTITFVASLSHFFEYTMKCHLLPIHAGPDLLGVLGRTNFDAPQKHLNANVAGNLWEPFLTFSGQTLRDPTSMFWGLVCSEPLVNEVCWMQHLHHHGGC